MSSQTKYILLVALALLVLLPGKAAAFGAGNIASISKIEGQNWRHGDIEDMLATVACLRGHKWNSMMIKRVYFGNWLRDYSQAVDVATLKSVQADTIRILVWILSFMSFGYATAEFEVTADRLGVYRPEEHIDNPKDYADNVDARKFDPRLRGPVSNDELAIDPETGMKNYIANERGGWATSVGYVKFSLARSIHFGRMYTHGPSGQRGREEDLCEALRCLGQGLHCLEDFGAHSNYTELALRELGHSNVFPHVGTQTQINLHGKHVFPLVTGTFGGVDFFHSVLGEATDHFTQSEVDQMNTALLDAVSNQKPGGGGSGGSRGNGSGSGSACTLLTDALGKVPGTSGLIQEAQNLQASSDAQAAANTHRGVGGGYNDFSGSQGQGAWDDYSGSRANAPGQQQQPMTFDAPPGSVGGPPGPNIPGTNTDPQELVRKIYPILEFRDKVVRSISAIISKIPGLEKLIETITERVTLFVLSLLAPFIMPVIKSVSKQLKQGSSAVVESAAKHQFEVWTNPQCSDPTHSMLSKDHFSNILNEPAGKVATDILQYVAPRVVYAWDHPDVPVDQVLNDATRVFHHPAIRDQHNEAHRNMFETVRKWADGYRKHNLDQILSSDSVRAGKNDTASHSEHAHGAAGVDNFHGGHGGGQSHGQGHQSSGGQHSSGGAGGLLGSLSSNLPGGLGNKLSPAFNLLSSGGGHRTRDVDDYGRPTSSGDPYAPSHSPQPSPGWGSFQPYQSSYAGGGNTEPYSAPPEYNYGAPNPTGQTWGQGQYAGGQGAEPAYSMPTAYQQGYEEYQGGAQGGAQSGYGQQQQGGGYDASYSSGGYGQGGQQEGGGRQWGAGGGSGW